MTPAYWLLELTIDGRVFRSATTRIDVDGVVYTAGLDDLQVEIGAEQVSIALTDPSVDWPNLARHADGGSATLFFTKDGTTTAITSGTLRVGSWGSRDEPFAATIERRAAVNGTQVPDALAVVSLSTWPLTAEAGAGVLVGDLGRVYPVIFGYPGFTVDDDGVEIDPYPVVPVPLAQRDDQIFGTGKTEVVIAEDGTQAITSVRLFNAANLGTSDEAVDQVNDNLGRRISRVRWTSVSATRPVVSDQQAEIYAGFSTSGGGGPRTAYDVLVYILRRWGILSADWSRIPQVQPVLERFLVDTWVDDPQTDPWSWFQSALMPSLPVAIRTSDRGRYLVETRFRSDPRRQIRSLDVDRGEATLNGALGLSDTGPYNEFVAKYRPSRERDWRSKVTLTSVQGIVSAGHSGVLHKGPVLNDPHNTASSLCARSLAQYGPQPADPVELDWCWDDGTALAVLMWMAERDALPAILGTYDVLDGDTLREGDEVLLTDSQRGLVEASAIVAGPPVLTSTGATIDFRIPP